MNVDIKPGFNSFGQRRPLCLAIAVAIGSLTLTACSSGGGGVSNNDAPNEYTPSSSTSTPAAPSVSVSPLSPDEVRVAVVDSAFNQAELINSERVIDSLNIHTGGRDVSGGNEWHGNVVASTITGGTLGNARLDLIKVENDGVNRSSAIDYAIGEAASRGARVINASFSQRYSASDPRLSFNGVSSPASYARVVNANDGKGAVYVVSAGNDGKAIDTQGQPIYASHPDLYNMMLIAVGTTKEGDIHPSSAYPGDDERLQARAIATDYVNRQVGAQGTSISAARISEYAAGILARWPHMSAQQASQRLLDTASHDSALFARNDCGSAGNMNCGAFYLGQGIADIDAALAPEGELVVAQSERLSEGGAAAESAYLQLSGAFGDSLAASGALNDVAVFDSLGRDYQADFAANLQPRTSRATSMRRQMEKLSRITPAALSRETVAANGFRVDSQFSSAGELVSSRFDGTFGNAELSAFSFAGDQASPMSAYAESNMMPMLSFQEGTAMTQGLDSVNGVQSRYALGETLSLVASHWAGSELTSGSDSDYRAQRSDIGVEWEISPTLNLTTQLGRSEERNGLLGTTGGSALGVGERNELYFASLNLQTTLSDGVSAFAEFEQGRGNVQGKGLLTHLDDIHARAMSLGLQWQKEDEQWALALRQPLRIDSGVASFDVPVGRTLAGDVIREQRSADLAPSGRQVDLELGYTLFPSERSQWQFNLLHTREPGHDADAPSDTAAMVSYAVAW